MPVRSHVLFLAGVLFMFLPASLRDAPLILSLELRLRLGRTATLWRNRWRDRWQAIPVW